jgi:hypothetical protein
MAKDGKDLPDFGRRYPLGQLDGCSLRVLLNQSGDDAEEENYC